MEHHTSPACACASHHRRAAPRVALRRLHSACRKPPRRDPSDSVHKVARARSAAATGARRGPRRPPPLHSSCPEKFRNFQLQVRAPRTPARSSIMGFMKIAVYEELEKLINVS
ncbi:hypothetical protein HU200_041443 [Digitaria exilis]|uniref:Uncharacterized protein n=1 Tax=Digitaria exilis TaxID=1010633 RepID=A0A835EHR5_9POAL|nr:hypothetical protein HU200_041443 [Digitaria exilis]